MRLIAKEEAAEAERSQRRELGRQALALKAAGKSLFDIATVLDVPEQTARSTMAETMKAVADVMDETERREHLAEMVTSMELLQQAVWPAAVSGDTRAVEAALKVLDRKAKLLGLDIGVTVDARQQNLIVQGPEYAQALRSIAAASRG
jgi:hypothetical protein